MTLFKGFECHQSLVQTNSKVFLFFASSCFSSLCASFSILLGSCVWQANLTKRTLFQAHEGQLFFSLAVWPLKDTQFLEPFHQLLFISFYWLFFLFLTHVHSFFFGQLWDEIFILDTQCNFTVCLTFLK